jgi:hypothetical protein
MMDLLIPCLTCPGKDFDVFLEPLIEDLLDLWKGVRTIDAHTGKPFNLHAAVLWCIHDYPTLNTLSGLPQKDILHVFIVTSASFISSEEKNWVFWALPFSSKRTPFAEKQ